MEATERHNIIEECERLAFADQMSFPQVVKQLAMLGAERYHADLVRLQKTYYFPPGDSEIHSVPLANPPAIAGEFAVAEVAEAVRAIQAGNIDYSEFLQRIMKAGTASYDVFLTGRKVVYTGRRGDFYVENFPGGK